MKNSKTLFIAEIGNNHNGDMKRAKRLITKAKDAGCQIAKFQLRNFDTLYRKSKDSVEDLGVEYTKDLLQKYELAEVQHRELFNFCNMSDIEYMCTPWDLKSLEFLETLNVKRYKVASADFDNLELVNALIDTCKPLIFSTGMATSAQIEEMVNYLNKRNAKFTILHCNSTYPAPFSDIELNYIKRLKKLTPSVGYSGHERGIAVSLAAIALGAEVIERHLTEDRNLEGPDHQASLLPDEFRQLIEFSAQIEAALGPDEIIERKLSQGSLLNKENLGKSIVAAQDLSKGTKITEANLAVKSPGQGVSPLKLPFFVGKILQRNVKKNDFIFDADFEEVSGDKPRLMLKNIKHPRWGIPVRPHDILKLHQIFDAKVYEFHVSYSDLVRPFPQEDWSFLRNKWLVVHAPELFEDSKLLDLCATDDLQRHLNNLQRVCDYTRRLKQFVGTNQRVPIVTNVGGFSTHEFRPEKEKGDLYERVQQSLTNIDEEGCEITIQNMAPFPWHFGGQRYQNIFANPSEIVKFCTENSRRITLDTAHLSMFCAYSGFDFSTALNLLLPITAHIHFSDAKGLNGEGVEIGTGDIDFGQLLHFITSDQSFIVETWQGHKNNGSGFIRDLAYLKRCEN